MSNPDGRYHPDVFDPCPPCLLLLCFLEAAALLGRCLDGCVGPFTDSGSSNHLGTSDPVGSLPRELSGQREACFSLSRDPSEILIRFPLIVIRYLSSSP
eukprot:748363-Hanusia_phi.AAC.2